ncbi:hypothetical protein [Agriterribacter sp.]|uniref:hypothetical protein n=1 Tax=Agriterribacter sp. TaxID=2821509 RepID=UPI002C1B3628|nr:hypothetical protein [Agriterribacter sp.]HRO45210.1 hypothetical protein [Agriterribacter sp.]HRQ16813.1 hypothetical protein [Agriterribacter sp.]
MFTLKRSVFAPSFFTVILLLFTSQLLPAQSNSVDFNRKAYYAAFTSADINGIEKQLDIISQSAHGQKDAFEGALMMKKAGLIKGASHKLKTFKAGREKLDSMIAANAGNAEFRFLRLMIQEKAPKILHYDQQLEEDRQYLVEHFRSVPESVQKAILDYSKSSKVLSPQDF